MTLSGNATVLGVIGHPIAHTASPRMHNAAFASLGMDGVYVPFLVPKDRVADAMAGVRALSIKGINVTIPFKETVIPFLDELDPTAAAIGAVNTIVNTNGVLKGWNTDGEGFILSLKEEAQFTPTGCQVAIIGAGGSAKAIAYTLLQHGIASLHILNRTLETGQHLANHLRQHSPLPIEAHSLTQTHVLASCDLVINTTPIGMAPHTSQSPTSDHDWIQSNQFVYDIIYNPGETILLNEAKQRGARTLNGAGMLAGQGCLAFRHFTGHSVPYTLFKNEVES